VAFGDLANQYVPVPELVLAFRIDGVADTDRLIVPAKIRNKSQRDGTMNKKILVVLTSVEKYPNLNRTTGLWLGEAAHFVKKAEASGTMSTV